MLRRAYDWCIAAADKPYALWLLGAISFAESSFFPIPPDIMLIPMSLAQPKRAYTYALFCTIASVTGGVLGYAIGALLYDSVGAWLIFRGVLKVLELVVLLRYFQFEVKGISSNLPSSRGMLCLPAVRNYSNRLSNQSNEAI